MLPSGLSQLVDRLRPDAVRVQQHANVMGTEPFAQGFDKIENVKLILPCPVVSTRRLKRERLCGHLHRQLVQEGSEVISVHVWNGWLIGPEDPPRLG